MFTGLVTDVGRVERVEDRNGLRRCARQQRRGRGVPPPSPGRSGDKTGVIFYLISFLVFYLLSVFFSLLI